MATNAEHAEVEQLIQATVVTYDDKPDECTLHPVDPDDERRTTEWITAREGAFLPLSVWR